MLFRKKYVVFDTIIDDKDFILKEANLNKEIVRQTHEFIKKNKLHKIQVGYKYDELHAIISKEHQEELDILQDYKIEMLERQLDESNEIAKLQMRLKELTRR